MASIEEEIKSKFESEQHKAVLNVLFTANWLKAKHNALLAPFGLSVQQFNILRILRGAKGVPMSMHVVKERMVDRAPNATRLADKLIAKGLVERERSVADRRQVQVKISTEGLKVLADIDATVRLDMAAMHQIISTEHAVLINEALDNLRGKAGSI
jgi:MarR family 2-MHQ and catechol resistance regulon transcriptional repressor